MSHRTTAEMDNVFHAHTNRLGTNGRHGNTHSRVISMHHIPESITFRVLGAQEGNKALYALRGKKNLVQVLAFTYRNPRLRYSVRFTITATRQNALLPRASRASVRSRTSSGSSAISAMPPALSATGPKASVARVTPKVASMPTAATRERQRRHDRKRVRCQCTAWQSRRRSAVATE